ncbi:MAG: DUF805 domain-containing protein [Allosphingosinicella sp.]
MEWATLPLKKYADFTGRARRKEYWMYVLLLIAAMVVAMLIESVLGLGGMVGPYGPLTALLLLGTFVPSIAVGVRRLHDTNRPGWWIAVAYAPAILMMLLPMLGILNAALIMILSVISLVAMIGLLVLMVLEGNKGPNQYGPDPKGEDLANTFA